MTQPTPYVRQYDFDSYQSSNPNNPLPSSSLEAELNSVMATVTEILANLAVIQRDDTLLANESVHTDAFTTNSLALMAGGWTPKGDWATDATYVVSDMVEKSGSTYVCMVPHTSGVFADDRAAGYWIRVANPGFDPGHAYFERLSGNGTTGPFTLEQDFGSDEQQFFVIGPSGQILDPIDDYSIVDTSLTFAANTLVGTNNYMIWSVSATSAASANAAVLAADAAAISEANANVSETNAQTAETNAAASAGEASVARINAQTAETNAAASEVASAAHASAAGISETNAVNAASGASVSEGNAASAAAAASTSQGNASTSETNAQTAETNAAISAANAAASETGAQTAEANAQTSETNAQTAEANAQTAEANAAASAAEVQDAKLVWRGGHNPLTAYVVNDAVAESGSSYVCTAPNTGETPPNPLFWGVLASRGDQGEAGAVTQSGSFTSVSEVDVVVPELLDSAYFSHTLYVRLTGSGVGSSLGIRISSDGGATYDDGAADYEWARWGRQNDGTSQDANGNGESSIAVTNAGFVGTLQASLKVELTSTYDASIRPVLNGHVGLNDLFKGAVGINFVGVRSGGNAAVGGIRLFVSSGTLTGEWVLQSTLK
ncbi:MAG: hypothetical protein ABJN40_05960 [Sneathiella sp.]